MPDKTELTDKSEEKLVRGGQMSFLEHLDELRRRLVYSVVIITVAFVICWTFSGAIYNFLSIPVLDALGEAVRRDLPIEGLTGSESVRPISELAVGERGRYIFDRVTTLGPGVVQPGSSVASIVQENSLGVRGLYTDEAIISGSAVIPKGVLLPVDLTGKVKPDGADERLIVTTAPESFTLYVTVSLYSAIALSIPLLLWQIWAFISPALYKHERAYVTPFVFLSTISFVIGAAFAYYILLPPALGYLLGLASDFRPMLRASDYLDFVTIVLLAMGFIFQMPAVTYVLSRIGLVSAGFLIRSWKVSIVVILIVAAFVSPTGDIPNLMLFATPMFVLYIVSIGIAWLFGRKRTSSPTV